MTRRKHNAKTSHMHNKPAIAIKTIERRARTLAESAFQCLYDYSFLAFFAQQCHLFAATECIGSDDEAFSEIHQSLALELEAKDYDAICAIREMPAGFERDLACASFVSRVSAISTAIIDAKNASGLTKIAPPDSDDLFELVSLATEIIQNEQDDPDNAALCDFDEPLPRLLNSAARGYAYIFSNPPGHVPGSSIEPNSLAFTIQLRTSCELPATFRISRADTDALSGLLSSALGLGSTARVIPTNHAGDHLLDDYARYSAGIVRHIETFNKFVLDAPFIDSDYTWTPASEGSELCLTVIAKLSSRAPSRQAILEALPLECARSAQLNGYFGTSAQTAAILASTQLSAPILDLSEDEAPLRLFDVWAIDAPFSLELDGAGPYAFDGIAFGPLARDPLDTPMVPAPAEPTITPIDPVAAIAMLDEHGALFDRIAQSLASMAAGSPPPELILDVSLLLAPNDNPAAQRLGRLVYLCAFPGGSASGYGATATIDPESFDAFLDSFLTTLESRIPSFKDRVKILVAETRERPRWAQRDYTEMLYPSPTGLKTLPPFPST